MDFNLINKIHSFFRKVFSLQMWIEYIHKKRIRPVIYIINKEVRKQKKDPLSIPVIIINYNRLIDLKTLVSFLVDRGHKNIVIIDNNSSYSPLLEYYKEIEDIVTIERLDKNYGHLVFWRNSEIFHTYSKGYYIITDSDIIPNDNLPENYLEQMIKLLDNHKEIVKVGFALRIDDIPDHYLLKQKVLKWEQKYWERSITKDIYMADIDTTFALYPPYYRFMHITDFYPAIRIAGNFLAKHTGWYQNNEKLTDEEIFYRDNANPSSSWKMDEKGNFVGSTYYKDLQ